MKCVHSDGYDITEGQYYQVLSQNQNTGAYKIVDDTGEVVWVPEHYLA